MPEKEIIIALDVEETEVFDLVQQLAPFNVTFKVGLQLMNSLGGPQIVKMLRMTPGVETVFYDSKLCDIPTTVGKAAKAISALEGVKYFNVHVNSGIASMQAAVANKGDKEVLAVTLLTSIDVYECRDLYGNYPAYVVRALADRAAAAGVDGIICSPADLEALKVEGKFPPPLAPLKKIVPGVRPVWAGKNDQARVMAPGEAFAAGASGIVIGRPITKPPASVGTPVDALKLLLQEI